MHFIKKNLKAKIVCYISIVGHFFDYQKGSMGEEGGNKISKDILDRE